MNNKAQLVHVDSNDKDKDNVMFNKMNIKRDRAYTIQQMKKQIKDRNQNCFSDQKLHDFQ
jgi:thiamine pyrophosphate-dependent acetolactate synthase large subunit-like protein